MLHCVVLLQFVFINIFKHDSKVFQFAAEQFHHLFCLDTTIYMSTVYVTTRLPFDLFVSFVQLFSAFLLMVIPLMQIRHKVKLN